ncbi:hypothetical protein VTI28DRAFT_8472 [Corynascus sepedonium]
MSLMLPNYVRPFRDMTLLDNPAVKSLMLRAVVCTYFLRIRVRTRNARGTAGSLNKCLGMDDAKPLNRYLTEKKTRPQP